MGLRLPQPKGQLEAPALCQQVSDIFMHAKQTLKGKLETSSSACLGLQVPGCSCTTAVVQEDVMGTKVLVRAG